jgi:putative ABC transport system substrate-binding protein
VLSPRTALAPRVVAALHSAARRSRSLAVGWLCVASLLGCGHALAAQRILVVASSESSEFLKALQGVRDVAGPIPVESMTLGITAEPGLRAALRQANRDTAVVALGPGAATLVGGAALQAPVVGCLLPSPDPLERLANKQIAASAIPADQQVAWLRRIMPQARNIGILYDPAQDTRRVGDLAAALRLGGLTPVLEAVAEPSMLPVAIERLSSAVDALLAVPDGRVYNQRTEKKLLLFSFRSMVPLIGQSDYWVKKGALYALDWDYREFGTYCGQLAMRQLAGPHSPAPVPPRPRLIINMHIAERFHFHWNDDIRALVDRTYD